MLGSVRFYFEKNNLGVRKIQCNKCRANTIINGKILL
jgi:hypothetical protein